MRGALVNLSRGNPTQPPLDLRSLSHQHSFSTPNQSLSSSNSNSNSHQQHSKEKLSTLLHNDSPPKSTVSAKVSKKEESLLDWTSLVYAKNSKDEDTYKNMKIPDWSPEEERKFRIDSEAKDTPASKRCLTLETLTFESTANSPNPMPTKKRNSKRQNAQESHADNSSTAVDTTLVDNQLTAKKTSPLIKSSPTSYRKGKSCKKDTLKLVNHEVQIDTSNPIASSATKDTTGKSEGNKRRQASGANNVAANSSNHYKKYETSAAQKVTQYSEEETSSTTTESSVQDDANTYKVILELLNLSLSNPASYTLLFRVKLILK